MAADTIIGDGLSKSPYQQVKEAAQYLDVENEKLSHDLFRAIEERNQALDENKALRAANEAFGRRQAWWNATMFEMEQQRDAALALVNGSKP